MYGRDGYRILEKKIMYAEMGFNPSPTRSTPVCNATITTNVGDDTLSSQLASSSPGRPHLHPPLTPPSGKLGCSLSCLSCRFIFNTLTDFVFSFLFGCLT